MNESWQEEIRREKPTKREEKEESIYIITKKGRLFTHASKNILEKIFLMMGK